MAYQTGTIDRLDQVVGVVRDFLVAQGWTVHQDFREPVYMRTVSVSTGGGTHDEYWWRWGRRCVLTKGTKAVSMQDFWGVHDLNYGTNGGFNDGPGLGIVLGTAQSVVPDPETEASKPAAWYRHYTLASDGVTPVFAQNGAGPITIPAWQNGVVNPAPGMMMPLPQIRFQETGTWSPIDFYFVNAAVNPDTSVLGHPDPDVDLWGPFGTPGSGPSGAIPMKYWLFSDATGDFWTFVTLHDNANTLKTPYITVGNLNKAGDWVGDAQFIACARATANAFVTLSSHGINRFAPPGSIMDDGGATLSVRMPAVDTTAAGWLSLGTGTRRILSTAESEVQGGTGPLGTKTGFGYGQLKTLMSSSMDAAVGTPIYLTVQRDTGLQSMIGSIPHIRQAHTFGIAMGTETLAPNGDTWVVFDGFMVRKIP